MIGHDRQDSRMSLEILERQRGIDDASRALRLRAATHAAHERLDATITAQQPFASRERYGCFLKMQYGFHHQIDALYSRDDLAALLPDLGDRRRLELIRQDLVDLNVVVPDVGRTAGAVLDLPSALGWLYVAEGSNLGAAFLLKEAAKLGLSEEFGARHLAAAPEGRGLQWKSFTAALNRVDLAKTDEARVIAGAEAAFAHVQAQVQQAFE
jgi:heme oxygenase